MKASEAFSYLQDVLGAKQLRRYLLILQRVSGRKDAHVRLVERIFSTWHDVCQSLHVDVSDASSVFAGLQNEVRRMDRALYRFFGRPSLTSVRTWEKIFSKVFASIPPSLLSGWFVKEEVAHSFLRLCPPKRIMRFLGYPSVDALLQKENIFEILAALRFGESGDWMHAFFHHYQRLQPADFERRKLKNIVFDPEKWNKLDATFVHKKFHPLSHLKEFGIVFLVPVFASRERVLPKIVGLFLHYIYEVHFYSQLFQRAAVDAKHFSDTLIALLKGDIQKRKLTTSTQLRIIHQYHLKKSHPDPLAFESHIHPEVLHWQKSLAQLIEYAAAVDRSYDFSFWKKTDFVLMRAGGKLVSMDFSDMAIDSKSIKTYHVHEALWNELFRSYFGSSSLSRALLQGFQEGYIDLETYAKTKN